MLTRKRRTTNSDTTDLLPQLPVEIWMSVFSYVHHSRDLRALCQTCKTFKPLVQPALFRFIVIVSPSLRIPPGTAKIKKRLKVLARPHIAPAIQALRVLSEYPHYPDHSVLDSIWNLISLSKNLSKLYISDMELPTARIDCIRNLPHLKELSLIQCRDTSHLTHFPNRFESLQSFQCDPELPWLTFFAPKTIERLMLSSAKTTSLPNSWTLNEAFPRLSYLRVSHWFVVHPLFTEVINAAPALRELVITSGKGPPGPLTNIRRDILAKLEAYEGPEYCAPMFAQGGKLLRATIWEYPFFTQDNDASGLDDSLGRLAVQCGNLSYLTLRLSVLPEDVFASASHFANLKVLHVLVKAAPPHRTRPVRLLSLFLNIITVTSDLCHRTY
jgi:hypothetical protein